MTDYTFPKDQKEKRTILGNELLKYLRSSNQAYEYAKNKGHGWQNGQHMVEAKGHPGLWLACEKPRCPWCGPSGKSLYFQMFMENNKLEM